MKLLLAILVSLTAFAEEVAVEAAPPVDVSKISEALGHLIGKNLESVGFQFDIALVIKGLQDAAAGKISPMSETECVQAIAAAQEAAFKQQSIDNLTKAAEFLATNGKQEGIITVEEGKLQYKIEKTGTGPEVQEHFSPLIRYTGKFLDGTVFGQSKEDDLVSLDETIPGFTKGLLGMKEGEKRTLFIHPEYGYGTSGYLPPNSLLTFEVEIVKANAPQIEEKEGLSVTQTKSSPEIASPLEEQKVVR